MNQCSLLARAALIALVVASGSAGAGNQRTFVASTGADTNPCSLNQPCRSFASAMALTYAGGEVIVLDSAGYGPVSITQSVSITAPSGIYAGISVFAGNGVTVSGANIHVTLGGLSINGQGGSEGISFQAGNRLVIERCSVTGMTGAGISVGASNGALTITDTQIRGNQNGIVFSDLVSTTVSATLSRVRIEYNAQSGLIVGAGGRVRATDSAFNNNSQFGILATPVADNANRTRIEITRSTISQNGSGGVYIESNTLGLSPADVATRLVDNVISDNDAYGVFLRKLGDANGLMYSELTRNEIASNKFDGVNLYSLGGYMFTEMGGNVISLNGLDGIRGAYSYGPHGGDFEIRSVGDNVVMENFHADVEAMPIGPANRI